MTSANRLIDIDVVFKLKVSYVCMQLHLHTIVNIVLSYLVNVLYRILQVRVLFIHVARITFDKLLYKIWQICQKKSSTHNFSDVSSAIKCYYLKHVLNIMCFVMVCSTLLRHLVGFKVRLYHPTANKLEP